MPQAATIETRLQLYRKVLVEEFLREFKYLIDVIGGRAQNRGDFTDKIMEFMKSGSSIIIGFVPAALPSVAIAKALRKC